MKLDDIVVSKGIVEGYMHDLLDYLEMDVAIGGGGPAGLTASPLHPAKAATMKLPFAEWKMGLYPTICWKP